MKRGDRNQRKKRNTRPSRKPVEELQISNFPDAYPSPPNTFTLTLTPTSSSSFLLFFPPPFPPNLSLPSPLHPTVLSLLLLPPSSFSPQPSFLFTIPYYLCYPLLSFPLTPPSLISLSHRIPPLTTLTHPLHPLLLSTTSSISSPPH